MLVHETEPDYFAPSDEPFDVFEPIAFVDESSGYKERAQSVKSAGLTDSSDSAGRAKHDESVNSSVEREHSIVSRALENNGPKVYYNEGGTACIALNSGCELR